MIHLTGVDAHQGAVLLKEGDDSRRKDGFYLADEDGGETVVGAGELGKILNAGRENTPGLVFVNAYNTASRLAAMAVAHGAGSSLGFQDTIDDQIAETFLANFYRAWTTSNYSQWNAFDWAWKRLKRQPRSLRGSGVVLWSERSFLGSFEEDPALSDTLVEERSTRYKHPDCDTLKDVLTVDYDVPEQVNYSTLHNNANIFDSFRLSKKVHELIEDVAVTVNLQVGAEQFTYRSMVSVDQNPTFLEDRIRVPLTWDFVRKLKESVRSTIYVEVSKGGCVLECETHSVSLQPVQEWCDTDEHRAWLPSFVLPRDPQVARIISHAQRYLCTLVDYSDAGFDGYQSLGGDSYMTDAVDLQVRAIWAALVFELDLMYINPPPSYAYGSQRLRTPSEVVESGHGTCIDLALLFVACLEYVDIYPAVFLLQGHAFPAYWRSDIAYEDFASMGHVFTDLQENSSPGSGRFDSVRRYKDWMIAGEASHQEILASVQRGDLVPIETVAMTNSLGFQEAIEQGMENLEATEEFESLIDIPLARRRYSVTPLPLQPSGRST